MIAAVSEHEVEKLRLYSDPACADLLKAAAAHFGLQPEQIMPGNGSDENLFFALRAFCDAEMCIRDRSMLGYETVIGPGNLPSNIAQGAAALCVAIKTKNKNFRQPVSYTHLLPGGAH